MQPNTTAILRTQAHSKTIQVVLHKAAKASRSDVYIEVNEQGETEG